MLVRKPPSIHRFLQNSAYIPCGLAKCQQNLERYRENVTKKRAVESIISEESRINVVLRDPITNYTLATLTPKVIAEFRDRRLDHVSGSTVNRDLALLSSVIETARKDWFIPITTNPVSLIRHPRNNPGRERRLLSGEEERLLEAITVTETRNAQGQLQSGPRNPWIKPFILFALETALRRSEQLRLEWSDVDLVKGTVVVKKGKNGHGRTIPPTTKAIEILTNLPRTDHRRVFPITADAVKKFWQRAVIAAGLEDLHYHDLRHEATSRFAEKGLTMFEAACISGHKDYRSLMRYVHLFSRDIKNKLNQPQC